jgi:hypothetical protein
VIGPTGGPETFAHLTICGAFMKWPCASMNEGINVWPPRSITLVALPFVFITSASSPAARIRPLATATAFTSRRSSSIVMMVPPRKIVSAVLFDIVFSSFVCITSELALLHDRARRR